MKKQLGFTLIEVLIVVIIVAILASVAIPSYQDSIRKTRRAEAKEALTSIAALQERYFFTNNNYADDLNKLGISNNQTENGYYTLALVGGVTCGTAPNQYPCYTVTATAAGPQTGDTTCESLSITHTGKKTASKKGGGSTMEECW